VQQSAQSQIDALVGRRYYHRAISNQFVSVTRGGSFMPDPVPLSEWRQVLADVAGRVVGDEERVGTAELVKLLGVPSGIDSWTKIGKAMRALGWRGPVTFRINDVAMKGYVRPAPSAESKPVDTLADPPAEQPPVDPPVPAAAVALAVPAIPSGPEELARRLERVCGLSLVKLEEVLSLPVDPKNGNVMRAITSCASVAVQCQLRADEAKLRSSRDSGIMARLDKLIRSEQRKIPKTKSIAEVISEPPDPLDAHGVDLAE